MKNKRENEEKDEEEMRNDDGKEELRRGRTKKRIEE